MQKYPASILLVLAMVLGYASLILPPILTPGEDQFRIPIPIQQISVLTDSKLSGLMSVIALCLTGVLLGFLDPELGPLWSFATMLPVAVLTTIEFLFRLAPHHLYPVEMFMYFVQAMPALIGAFVGCFLHRIIPPAQHHS